MHIRKLLIVALTTVAFTAYAKPSLSQSFFPKKDVAQFLAQNLDLSTFRNSLGPRRTETQRTFAALGILPTQVQADEVVMESNEWFYSLRILRRADINGDGLEDFEVCFTDRAKQGTYSAQQALLVTRYSTSSYAVALKFEVSGCGAYTK